MKSLCIFFILLSISSLCISQDYKINEGIEKLDEKFELIGVSSKDNSKIYLYKEKYPTTVFSYIVNRFEIKIYKNTIVGLHYVLEPKDNTGNIPKELINQISEKSGREPILKDSSYYFDDISSKTTIFRKQVSEYGGDKIHILISSTDYLYK